MILDDSSSDSDDAKNTWNTIKSTKARGLFDYIDSIGKINIKEEDEKHESEDSKSPVLKKYKNSNRIVLDPTEGSRKEVMANAQAQANNKVTGTKNEIFPSLLLTSTLDPADKNDNGQRTPVNAYDSIEMPINRKFLKGTKSVNLDDDKTERNSDLIDPKFLSEQYRKAESRLTQINI